MFPPDSPPTVDAERGAAAPERRAGGMFPPDSPPAVDAGGAASEPGHGIRSKARKTWPSEEHREAAILLLRHGFTQSIKSLPTAFRGRGRAEGILAAAPPCSGRAFDYGAGDEGVSGLLGYATTPTRARHVKVPPLHVVLDV